jgi:hypothetical protein
MKMLVGGGGRGGVVCVYLEFGVYKDGSNVLVVGEGTNYAMILKWRCFRVWARHLHASDSEKELNGSMMGRSCFGRGAGKSPLLGRVNYVLWRRAVRKDLL